MVSEFERLTPTYEINTIWSNFNFIEHLHHFLQFLVVLINQIYNQAYTPELFHQPELMDYFPAFLSTAS